MMVSLPPYRSSVYLRIIKALPNVDLIALITHHPMEGSRWPAVPPDVVQQVLLAPDHDPTSLSVADHLKDARKAVRALRWLHRNKPDVVLVHGYNDVTRLLTIAWCKLAGCPVFLAGDSNIKGDTASGIRRVIKSSYLRPLVRTSNAVLPFGSMGRLYFRRYGAPESRIFNFPAEPDYAAIDGAARKVSAVIGQRLGFSPRRRRLLYSGRLAPEKRVALLLAAFGKIASVREEWDVVLLGSGPERDNLASDVTESLASRVIFVPAIQDATEVYAVYHQCDVLVLPSDHEPWALVVNEAAASGLALVCSDVVGAAADLVREGVNGRTFRKGDVDDLVAALLDVTDPAHLDRYKSASIDVVNEWRRVADPVAGFAAAMRSVGVLKDGD